MVENDQIDIDVVKEKFIQNSTISAREDRERNYS